jgi:hypothetical protein
MKDYEDKVVELKYDARYDDYVLPAEDDCVYEPMMLCESVARDYFNVYTDRIRVTLSVHPKNQWTDGRVRIYPGRDGNFFLQRLSNRDDCSFEIKRFFAYTTAVGMIDDFLAGFNRDFAYLLVEEIEDD